MSARLHILLVENKPGDADIIRDALAADGQEGFEIEPVPGLSEALERIGQGGIDIVMLDLEPPDSDGLETLRAMRQGGQLHHRTCLAYMHHVRH